MASTASTLPIIRVWTMLLDRRGGVEMLSHLSTDFDELCPRLLVYGLDASRSRRRARTGDGSLTEEYPEE
jgi:hypothetical protein